MPFGTPITIREAISAIERRRYLLPGIQREFVWGADQIARLFDSLLRGYPIGSFLFWQVEAEKKQEFQFYEFVKDYHERDGRHNPKASAFGEGAVTAILDGQQRLTSLYIGLAGTYSDKRRYARRDGASSYARRRLYVNIARRPDNPDRDYDFCFREDDADWAREGSNFWYRVGHILSFKHATDVFRLVVEQGLATDLFPQSCLVQLHRVITDLPLINFFTETEQDLDRVLNIFIRVNSGGQPLSYSDLLLSIASAQWEERDAREEIHALVDQINRDFGEFEFPRDFVLKSCLMLTDVDLRWRVENFNRNNMRRIEQQWPRIADSIRLAVKLLASFGFSAHSLPSNNAAIPIVYYLYQRGNPAGYVEAAAFRGDRDIIRRWLHVVSLKKLFGGVPDNVLRPIREVIRTNHETFPSSEIADALRTGSRSLVFSSGEIDGLLENKYGGAYPFSLLALLYPSLDFRNHFHVDHIHPRGHLVKDKKARDTIGDDTMAFFRQNVDTIPNLQLLEGQPNIEKSDKAFVRWVDEVFPNADDRVQYERRNFIPSIDGALESFRPFFEGRRQLLHDELCALLGVEQHDPVDAMDDGSADAAPAGFHPACMKVVERHLATKLSPTTTSCYENADDSTRIVCLVSKPYSRGGETRYWYAFTTSHVQYLAGSEKAHIAFGCGSAATTLLIPTAEFQPLLAGMRQTKGKRGVYWHVEIFGLEDLEIEQSLISRRVQANRWIVPDVTVHQTGAEDI